MFKLVIYQPLLADLCFLCLTLTYFSFMFSQITTEVAKLPQSRFLPRPPGHDLPLKIEVPKFQARSSIEWIKQHGLKGINIFFIYNSRGNCYMYNNNCVSFWSSFPIIFIFIATCIFFFIKIYQRSFTVIYLISRLLIHAYTINVL